MEFSRGNEEPFFQVLFCDDLWREFKKYMYLDNKVSNFYNYRDGDTAVVHGYFGLVLESTNLTFTAASMNYAAEEGYFDIIKFLFYNKNIPISNMATVHTACRGDLNILEFLYENSPSSFDEKTINIAAGTGHLHIVQFLYNKNIKPSINALNWSIEDGHLDIVKYLHDIGITTYDLSAIRDSIYHKHNEIIKFLYKKDNILDLDNIFALIIYNNNVELLEFFYRNHKDLDNYARQVLPRDDMFHNYLNIMDDIRRTL